MAQTRPAQASPPSAAAPDLVVVSKLVWSTLAAVDHANQTGNYSVLRDLGAPSFRARNSNAALAGIFQSIRNQRLDLSNTLLLAPTYQFAPTIVQEGLLRARGSFGLRPLSIGFDLLFQNNDGRWQLFGVSIVPLSIPTAQASPTRR